MNGLGTNDCTIINDLNVHITQSTVGHKGTVFNSAKAFIRQCPDNILRNFSGCISCVSANRSESVGGMRNKIIVCSLYQSMIEDTGSYCSRSNYQCIRNRTFTAACGRINQYKLIRSLANSTESCRVTTVQMNSLHTSKFKHNFCLLLNCNTHGFGRLATVGSHQDKLTISSQAKGLTRIKGCFVKTSYYGTILNQVNVTLDSFLDLTLVLRILTLSADHVSAILQHSEEGITVTIRAGDIYTVHYEGAQRLTVVDVIVSCVNTRNNLKGFGHVCLNGRDLITQGLHAVYGILVVHVVSHDLNSVKRSVNRGDIHLNTFVVLIVHNDLVHGNTGSQC